MLKLILLLPLFLTAHALCAQNIQAYSKVNIANGVGLSHTMPNIQTVSTPYSIVLPNPYKIIKQLPNGDRIAVAQSDYMPMLLPSLKKQAAMPNAYKKESGSVPEVTPPNRIIPK